MRSVLTAALLAAAVAPMHLRSSDFPPGGVIAPAAMAEQCGGRNRSPQLSWSGAPAATKSFALIVHDPDAPMPGGFYHWVVYNLPASTRRLPAAAKLTRDQLGVSSAGRPGYYGPCPPPGPPHHYDFTLYALDLARIRARAPLTSAQLETHMAGHVLARATLAGTAAHR